MNVQVISSKCTGQGVCYGNGVNGCPSVFAEGDEGKAVVIQTPTTDLRVLSAQANCCQGAIVVS
ncbi:MAG TPA: hypothetical protein V6D00_12115 [Pantanalinema sp.]